GAAGRSARERAEPVGGVEDEAGRGPAGQARRVTGELDGPAEGLVEPVRQERLVRPGGGPGGAHGAVQAETGLRDVWVEGEPQEVRQLLPQDLLVRVGEGVTRGHAGITCCACRGWCERR